jgi:hypothetical protein
MQSLVQNLFHQDLCQVFWMILLLKGTLLWIIVDRGPQRPTVQFHPVATLFFTRSAASLSSLQRVGSELKAWDSELRESHLTGLSFGPEGE